MPEAVIVAAARTPIGRARKGSLVDVDAFELARDRGRRAVIERSGIAAGDIDDIVVAESLQGGGVIARNIAVRLGLTSVPGPRRQPSLRRRPRAPCRSPPAASAPGMDRVVVAGGTESLSSMPRDAKSIPASARDYQPWMSPSHPETPDAPACDMSITVGENTAREVGLTREDVDEWALLRTERAAAVDRRGLVRGRDRAGRHGPDGGGGSFSVDEHPRPDRRWRRSPSLPVLHPEIEGFTVTAGNAAGLNDGAAAVVSSRRATTPRAHGLTPMAAGLSWASVGLEPARTGLGADARDPEGARPRRACRSTTSTCSRSTRRSARCRSPRRAARASTTAIMNVNGSGCGLGHPIACDRRAHGGHDGQRAAPPRPHPRLRLDVRGRRHGLGPGDRAALDAAARAATRRAPCPRRAWRSRPRARRRSGRRRSRT